MRSLTVLALAGVLAGALAVGCAKKESPEVLIRKALDDGAAALEARDSDKAAQVLSDSYKDDRKRTKKQLKQLAFFALQQGPLLVSMQNVDIKVDGDQAHATLKVLAVQGSAELKTAKDLLPQNARAFDLDVALAKQDGAWKVTARNGLSGASFLE